MIFGGPIIDIFTSILTTPFAFIDTLWVRVVANGFGCVILAFGMTMVMKSEAGTGPNDLVSIVFSDKTKKNFGMCRIAFDILFCGNRYSFGRICRNWYFDLCLYCRSCGKYFSSLE